MSTQTRLYARRWSPKLFTPKFKIDRIVLATFSLMSCANAVIWNTFSPVSRSVIQYFETSSVYVDALSFVYMAIYIPFVFPASWAISKWGIFPGVLLGGGMTVVGAWIRYIAFVVGLPAKIHQYYIVFAGQTIAALAQCFILQIPPLVADNWFPTDQRALATSIGALMNQLGIAVGFLVSPQILDGDPKRLGFLQMVIAIASTACFLFLCLGFRGSPPHPPSVSKGMSIQSEPIPFKEEMKNVFEDKYFILLCIAYGLNIGVFYGITTLLDQLLGPYHYTSNETGWFGFAIVIAGLFGAIIGGFDKTLRYKELLIVCYGGAVFSMIWFSLALRPDQTLLLGVSCAFIGFFLTALLPISLEASLEITYPKISGELSSALMMNTAQIFGVICILGMNPLIKLQLYHWSTVLLTSLSAFSLFLLFFWHPIYHRLKHETNGVPFEGLGLVNE